MTTKDDTTYCETGPMESRRFMSKSVMSWYLIAAIRNPIQYTEHTCVVRGPFQLYRDGASSFSVFETRSLAAQYHIRQDI